MTRFTLYFYGLVIPPILLWQNVLDGLMEPGTVLALYGLTLCGLALLYVYHIDTREEDE
jgi:hypothetical protein